MSEPTHIDRIPVDMTVDARGNINWNPVYRDYNETVFHRGKTVTNDEFNDLHKKSAYQGNYLTDSLKALLGEHLNSAIVRNITTRTNSVRSYVKPFVSTDWGELQQDGYYYINIPVTEHGLTPNADAEVLERMNIKAQMYLLDSNNNFYEVQQVEIDTQNNVTIYTDDNTLSGFVIIGINDKTYTLIDENINANLITGLADVATSGDYNDLINTPDTRITALENTVAALTGGTTAVAKAARADTADKLLSTSLIQGVPVSSIFELGSGTVKNATKVQGADFSASTPTQIGAYIISKKKLLYSWGGSGFEINNTIQTVTKPSGASISVDSSKAIEIKITPNHPSVDQKNYIYLKFKIAHTLNTTNTLKLICNSTYADNVFSWYTLELNIRNPFTPSTSSLDIQCQKYTYNITTNTVSTSGVNSRLYLYAIYEITE